MPAKQKISSNTTRRNSLQKKTSSKKSSSKITSKAKATSAKSSSKKTSSKTAPKAKTTLPKSSSKKTSSKTAPKAKTTLPKSSSKKTSSKTAPKAKTTLPKSSSKKASSKTAPKTKTTSAKSSSKKTSSKTVPKAKTTLPKPSSKKDIPLPFAIGEYIFYPNEGLGLILGTSYRKFNNEKVLYYTIEIKTQRMISHIPVQNIKSLRIRRIIGKATVKKVFDILTTVPSDTSNFSWKDRLILYQEIIRKSNTIEMAKMIATLYIRKQTRPLSFQERQNYDFTFDAVSGELAVATGLDKDVIETRMIEQLDKLIEIEKKQ